MEGDEPKRDAFRWSDLDHESIEKQLRYLKSAIEEEIKSDERLDPIPERPQAGSFKTARQAHSFEVIQQERADDWIVRAYKIYCDDWQRKGGKKTQDFVYAVWCNALYYFINDDVLKYLRLTFCVDDRAKKLLERGYGGLPQATEAHSRMAAINRIYQNILKLWQETRIPKEATALKVLLANPDKDGSPQPTPNLLKVSDLAPVTPVVKTAAYNRSNEKNLRLKLTQTGTGEALQQLLKELTQQERLAKELTDLQGPELAISVFGRTELEIAEEIKPLKISAIASQQSAVPEALTAAGSVPLKRPIEKLPAKKTDLARYLDEARLTERQRECISLKLEYGLGITAIAERLGISRKTVDEHIEAAERNLSAARDREKNSANRARSGSQQ